MIKLLALLFVVKLYARNDIFKEIFDIVLNETWCLLSICLDTHQMLENCHNQVLLQKQIKLCK